jgi:hypothetical protein
MVQAARAIEEPEYTVILREGAGEVRAYAPHLLAEVTVQAKSSWQAGDQGFRLLADYIFGNNTSKTEIAMTAPVGSRPQSQKIEMTAPVGITNAKSNEWVISFVLPQRLTLATAPTPNNSRVQLREQAERSMAVWRFSGNTSTGELARAERSLAEFMQKNALTCTGTVELARYDPPWTLPFLKRNEVMCAIVVPTP